MEFNFSITGNNIPLTGSSSITTGFSLSGNPGVTSTLVISPQYSKKVENVEITNNDGETFIEITYRLTPNSWVGASISNFTKQKMSKEIYGAKDGKLQLLKTIKGIEEPGYYVEPSIEWEE